MIKEGTEFLDQLKDKVHEQQWEIERLKQFSKNTYETSQELLAEKQARIDKVYYGAKTENTIENDCEYLETKECSEILTQFFKDIRNK